MRDMLDRLKATLANRYQIDQELGSGGMATVYLAHDLKHDREVALKVMRPELAAVLGGERFLREIRIAAKLNHPHILALHDSGEADGFLYYVMPHVEGESLRNKLTREKQLPMDEAITLAKQVAAALDHAHQQGVIHRDVKPENILIHQGEALVADFGIALAVTAAGGTRLTDTGLSLGTPEYMSPEQATGEREVDARSDVYSLGAVLYEMVAGEPPHTGNTVQAIIAKVVSVEPQPMVRIRHAVPDHVDAAVQCALAKVPADRFATAREFAAALTDAAFARTVKTSAPTMLAHYGPWKQLSLGFAALAAVLAGVALWGWLRAGVEPEPIRRLALTLPEDAHLSFSPGPYGVVRPVIALSPDGSMLAYVGQAADGGTQLYVRHLDTYDVRPLAGTEGALTPFFSPDGEWVAFFTGYELKRVSVRGSEVVSIAETNYSAGGSWGSDGFIYYAPDQPWQVFRVSPAGGPPVEVAARGRWPDVLPEGKALLLAGTSGGIYATDLESGDTTRIATGTQARYAAPGFVAFSHEGTLWVLPFDPETLRATGTPVQVATLVRHEAGGARATQFAVSAQGTLAYIPGPNIAENRLVWAGRDASLDTLPFAAAMHEQFELSPDGTKIAVEIGGDLWIYDLTRGLPSQVTFDGVSSRPTWHPDGSHVTFRSDRVDRAGHALMRVSGTGDATPLLVDSGGVQSVFGMWSRDGERFAFVWDGSVVVTDSSGRVWDAITTTPFREAWPRFSPDGRWLAYSSMESGAEHIYVQPYPPTGDRTQISFEGGAEEPRWSADGTSLIFRSGRRWLESAIQTEPQFRASRPRVILEGDYINVPGWSWDIAADGERLLVVQGTYASPTSGVINVVLNWLAEVQSQSRFAAQRD